MGHTRETGMGTLLARSCSESEEVRRQRRVPLLIALPFSERHFLLLYRKSIIATLLALFITYRPSLRYRFPVRANFTEKRGGRRRTHPTRFTVACLLVRSFVLPNLPSGATPKLFSNGLFIKRISIFQKIPELHYNFEMELTRT